MLKQLRTRGLGPREAHLAMALQTVVIGPGYLLGQSAARAFDPFVLISLRTVMAALLLMPVFYYFGGWVRFRPTRRQWRGLALLTLVGVVLNSSLFVIGLRYTTPANSALLYALTPALVLLLAVLVLRDERLSWLKALGVFTAFAGVVVLFVGQGKGFAGELFLGNVITLVAVLLWASYMALSRRVLPGLSPMQVPPVLIGLGAVVVLPVGIWRISATGWPDVPSEAWGGLAYLTLVNSVFSFLVVQFALSRLKASQVAVYMNLQPLSAFAFSWAMGREQPSWGLFLGAVLTIGGIAVLNAAQQRLSHTAEGEAHPKEL